MRKDTFIVYQVSPKETIRYEIPMALEPDIREWWEGAEIAKLTGLRGYPKTIARWISVWYADYPECRELFDQIKVTKTPTVLRLRGYEGTITTYDYPI